MGAEVKLAWSVVEEKGENHGLVEVKPRLVLTLQLNYSAWVEAKVIGESSWLAATSATL